MRREDTIDLGSTAQVLLLVLIAIALSSFYYTGFYASDDFAYLSAAKELLGTGNLSNAFGQNRIGLIAIIAALLKLTRGSIFLTTYCFVLFHAVLVALCYGIGRVAHDHVVGLTTAALAAVFPLAYMYAGSLLPDILLTDFVAAAFLCLLVIVRRAQNSVAIDWSCALLALLAGIFTGLGYMVKEYTILFVVPAGAILATAVPPRPAQSLGLLLAYCLGVGLIWFGELVLFRIVTNSWVFRLDLGSEDGMAKELIELRDQQGIWPWERIGFLYLILRPILGYWTFVIAGAFIVYPVLNRIDWPGRSTAMATFVSGLWLWAYLVLGTSSPSMYLPGPIVDRYYVMLAPFVLPPAAYVLISLAGLLTEPFSRSPRLGGGLTGLVVITIVAVFGVERVVATYQWAGDIYKARDVAPFLAAYRDASADPSGLPILLSSYHAKRMYSLFPSDFDWSRDKALPVALLKLGEPFFFVVPMEESKQWPSDRFLQEEAKAGRVTMTPAGRGRYYPPVSRWVSLFNALSPLSEEYVPEIGRRGVLLFRADPIKIATEPAPEPGATWIRTPQPWHALTDGFATKGHWLTWRAGTRGNPGQFQLYARGLRTAAALRAGTVAVQARMQIGALAPAEVTIHLSGYRGSERIAQGTRKVTLSGSELIPIKIDLSYADGVESFRVRVTVTPSDDAPGAVFIRHLLVRPYSSE